MVSAIEMKFSHQQQLTAMARSNLSEDPIGNLTRLQALISFFMTLHAHDVLESLYFGTPWDHGWYIRPRDIRWFDWYLENIPRTEPLRFKRFLNLARDILLHL